MAAYISVPRDLTKVKSKIAFNLTKRQLVCFGTCLLYTSCTNSYQQAYRWADRRSADGIVNVYRYVENPDLKILRFPEMSDEWLDFIAKCRAGETHPYDIVEDPMACLLYTSRCV